MSDFPKDYKDTGRTFHGVKVATSEIVPHCYHSFIMRGTHERTGQPGWYAFCKRSGEIDQVGPHRTVYEAMEMLILTKGCDDCELNVDERKGDHLKIIQELENEVKELFSDTKIYQSLTGQVSYYVQNRVYVDLYFRKLFGIRFFKSLPDDSQAALDLVKPATNTNEFSVKIQALAGLIDRIDTNEVRKVIKSERRDEISGSIRILDTILKENVKEPPRHIIGNLRNLQSLRSRLYPTHSTSSRILIILENFGISRYPPDDWEEAFQQILGFCVTSLQSLVVLLQDLDTSS